MPRAFSICLSCATLAGIALIVTEFGNANAMSAADDASQNGEPEPAEAPHSIEEARARARLLHESLHATLHFVHRAYFREDEGLAIPATTLESVFAELESEHNVRLRWLAVNTRAMDVDHKPADDFEEAAVKAIAEGAEYHEAREGDHYRFAGSITLTADCLSCHHSARSSNDPRAAALAITMPMQQP